MSDYDNAIFRLAYDLHNQLMKFLPMDFSYSYLVKCKLNKIAARWLAKDMTQLFFS